MCADTGTDADVAAAAGQCSRLWGSGAAGACVHPKCRRGTGTWQASPSLLGVLRRAAGCRKLLTRVPGASLCFLSTSWRLRLSRRSPPRTSQGLSHPITLACPPARFLPTFGGSCPPLPVGEGKLPSWLSQPPRTSWPLREGGCPGVLSPSVPARRHKWCHRQPGRHSAGTCPPPSASLPPRLCFSFLRRPLQCFAPSGLDARGISIGALTKPQLLARCCPG